MEKVKLLQLDLRAENPDNYIDETQPVTVRTRDWYRPDYAPFYEKDFELYDGNGELLRKNKDYVFETLNDTLLKDTGKPVYLFFRILNTALNNKKSFRIKYRSVGNTGFPRSLIGKMTNELIHSEYWVDWETQVLGKPETLPAYQHWHDVANEVANWDQFIAFADMQLEMVVRGRKDHWVENETKIDRSERDFTLRHRAFWNMLDDHDQDYDNPHRLVRDDFELKHIPNYPLSNASEDLSGVNPVSFTTPRGLLNTVQQKRRISPGHVAAGRLGYTAPPRSVGVTREQNIETLTLGGIRKYMNGDMRYIVAAADDQAPTGIWLTDDDAELLQVTYHLAPVYPQVGGRDLPMDRTLRVIGKGYAVTHHSEDLSALFYPNPDSVLNRDQKDCVKLDMSKVNADIGAAWRTRSWFFSVGNHVLLLASVPNTNDAEYKLYAAKMTALSPTTTLVMNPMSVGVEDADGIVSNPVTTLPLIDVVKGGGGAYRTYHHSFVSDVTPTFTGHMTVLTGDDDLRKQNSFFIKIIKAMVVNGHTLPIEMSWSFSLDDNTLYRNLSGSNAKVYKSVIEIDSFDTVLADYVKRMNTDYPDVHFGLTGTMHLNGNNGVIRRLPTGYDNLFDLYLSNIGRKVKGGIVEKRLIGLPAQVSPWHFGVLTDTDMVYMGKRVNIKRNIWDIRNHIVAGSTGSIYVHVGYVGGKLRSWLSTSDQGIGHSAIIAKADYTAGGITKVTLSEDN